MDRLLLQRSVRQGLSLEKIARLVDRDPSTVGYWLKKYGLESAHRERHGARGALEREALERLVAAGASVADMAERLNRGPSTVRHWLRRYGLRTKQSARLDAARAACSEGKAIARMTCRRHGATEFYLEGRGAYRCLRCRSEAVARRRRLIKRQLVTEAGGHCHICGYDRYIGALQFHHLDPAAKTFSVGQAGLTRSLERARQEAQKCALLCSNCHAEVEGGLASLTAAGSIVA